MSQPKYAVVFGRDGWEDGRFVLVHGHVEALTETIEQAKAARKVSGDLVFNLETREIVADSAWLFDYEKQAELGAEPTREYAVQAIQKRIKLAKDFWNTTEKRLF